MHVADLLAFVLLAIVTIVHGLALLTVALVDIELLLVDNDDEHRLVLDVDKA